MRLRLKLLTARSPITFAVAVLISAVAAGARIGCSANKSTTGATNRSTRQSASASINSTTGQCAQGGATDAITSNALIASCTTSHRQSQKPCNCYCRQTFQHGRPLPFKNQTHQLASPMLCRNNYTFRFVLQALGDLRGSNQDRFTRMERYVEISTHSIRYCKR